MSDIRLSGAVSGLDWESLVSQLIAVERKPITQLESKKKTLENKSTAWKDINSKLYSLQSKAQALKSRDTFYSRKAESSDSTVATATASSSVAPGTYTVEVIKLARAHTVVSGTFADPAEARGITGNPVINGKTIAIEASDSLNSIRDKINNTADIGVTASVVQVSPGQHRLVLVAKETGTSNAISFTDDNNALLGLGLLWDDGGTIKSNTTQEAVDAEVKVNSLTISRSTNTIADAVGGLNLQIKAEGKTATITVTNDSQKAVDAVKALVSEYNAVYDYISSKMSYDKETKTAGLFMGETTLTQILGTIRRLVLDPVEGLTGSITRGSDMGLSTGTWDSGDINHLQLDESKFTQKLESNLDDVARLFGAYDLADTKGIGARLYSQVKTYTQTGGLVPERQKALSEQQRRLQERIDSMNQRLDQREQNLRRQFINMEITIARLKSQGSWLDSQISSMSGQY
ncbi:MAG: flagellar filament capping protein FliD [Firmicutes bacterium]|nr:flagellar filament capping protein FliD [Bacillota bacterium]